MVLALLAGLALGSVGGIALGTTFMHKVLEIKPRDFLAAIDISADDNANIPMPQTGGTAVSVFKKRLLQDTSPWLTHPDYDRVLFMNTILEILWPHLSPAIHKMVIEQAKAPLADVCKKAKVLQEIRIDRLDLGSRPPRVDCFKSYHTAEDELIVEAPAFWGGDIHVRVTAVVKAGAKTIDVPVDVAAVQFKALARVTVKPLVETLPCMGGVTVSLLETPHFNMDLRIGDSWDLMALPGVPLLVGTAIKLVAGQLAVYPNEYALPLMPNYGLQPPPLGMLHVKVVSAKGLKGSFFDRMDAFVKLEVRKGRPLKTKVIPNSETPEWNEEFDFVVDSVTQQGLRLVLKDDDLLGASTEGEAAVPFAHAEFIAKPRTPVLLTVPLHHKGKKGKVKARDAALLDAATAGPGTSPGSDASETPTLPGGEKKKNFLRRGLNKLRRKKDRAPSPADAAQTAVAANIGGHVVGTPGSDVGTHATMSTAPEDHEEDVDSAVTTPRLQIPAGALTGATVTIECTYFPFKAAAPEGVIVEQAGAAQHPQEATVTSVRRQLITTTQPDLTSKGVLTVTLSKCTGLGDSLDTFAVVSLYDPHRLPIPNIEFKSDVIMNEDNPRFNLRRDFVNVSAASSLSVHIYEKAGTLDALKSLKLPVLQKAHDKMLGRMRVAVADVVMEGRLKDQWPLLEAQTGDVHMTLEWNPVVLAGTD